MESRQLLSDQIDQLTYCLQERQGVTRSVSRATPQVARRFRSRCERLLKDVETARRKSAVQVPPCLDFSSISRSGDRIPSEVKSNTSLRWQPMCDANIGLAVYQGATTAGGDDELCRGRLQRPQAVLSFNDKHHTEVGCVLLREFSARYLASRCERRELPFALIAQCDALYLSWSLAPYCFR